MFEPSIFARALAAWKIGATWLGLRLLEAAGLPEFVVPDAQLFIRDESFAVGRGMVTVYKRWVRLSEANESALPEIEYHVSWYPAGEVASIYDMEKEKGGLYVDDEAEICEQPSAW